MYLNVDLSNVSYQIMFESYVVACEDVVYLWLKE